MTARVRCAIYTRKSSEEGLEQSFNSLQAQREACEAYILSQRHEGWQAISTHYDDGGFSGGSMDRPALERLLDDIAAGKVNTVVVYKVDRLTRSLADFAKIVELLDSKQVSFVSVTQQFNTTTSMGRLTLNVLLSFAQFEREVTGERIRDKIAASKRKGMWMGGYVPLGYDLDNRKLVINEQEAATVREIYRHYLRLGCVSALKEYLDQSPIRSKVRSDAGGNTTGGGRFSRGALYQLLKNHLYVGEIAHKGQIHAGEHKAIIERDAWDKVQQLLTENRQGVRRRTRSTKPSLLTGILFDEQGNRYTPTHAIKRGKRYRYYASQAVIRKTREGISLARIPADELERAVTARVLTLLVSSEDLIEATRKLSLQGGQLRSMLDAASQRAEGWEQLTISDRQRFVQDIMQKVTVRQDALEIGVNATALIQAIHGKAPGTKKPSCIQTHTLTCPFQQVSRGQELRLIVGENKLTATNSTTALIKAIARARYWYERIISGEATSITDLARQNGVTPHYVSRVFSCALLAPNLVETILHQRHRPDATLDTLVTRLPLEWERQAKAVLG